MSARLRPGVAALLASLAALGGCAFFRGSPPPTPAPTRVQIENLTYSRILEQPVTLQDGAYAGAPLVDEARPAVLLWNDLIAFGDLDGAAGDEAVVLLSSSAGAGGERIYLAVVGVRDGQPVNLGTLLIGDRVKVRSLAVADGRIALEFVKAGEGDAACCPSQLTRGTYELVDTEVRLVSEEAGGKLSVATLEGADWQLVWLDQQALPPGMRAPTLTLAGARVSGFSGCNAYTGGIEETSPGEIKLSQLAGTRKACPSADMDIEREFLLRMENVDRYTFLAGRLALTGERDGDRFLLLFKSKPALPAGR
jgi:heat shock protein HslJ